jgi:hypothetical protein
VDLPIRKKVEGIYEGDKVLKFQGFSCALAQKYCPRAHGGELRNTISDP